MNRSRKDVTMMVAMAALLIFAVFNFVFKPQRSELSTARGDLRTRRAADLRRRTQAASPGVHHHNFARRRAGSCAGSSGRSGADAVAQTSAGGCGTDRGDVRGDHADPAGREPERTGRFDVDLDHRCRLTRRGAGVPQSTARSGPAARDRADLHHHPAGRRRPAPTARSTPALGSRLHAPGAAERRDPDDDFQAMTRQVVTRALFVGKVESPSAVIATRPTQQLVKHTYRRYTE